MTNMTEDPWGGQNPLRCCKFHVTPGGAPVHGGPDCVWPSGPPARTEQEYDAMTTYASEETRPTLPDRDELNISTGTAELLELIDAQEDGDVIAQALEAALLALVDISGSDPLRPAVARPGKVARRAIDRARDILEVD